MAPVEQRELCLPMAEGYRQLKRLGVDRFLAWNTAKSAHGPWPMAVERESCALPRAAK